MSTPLEKYAWKDQTFYILIISLDIINYLCLPIYLTDFMIKMIDSFKEFWQTSWDLFDLFITFIAIISEFIFIIVPISSLVDENPRLINVAHTLRAFRILRILKLIPRVQALRLVTLALSRSFKAGIFLSVLFFIFAFIFSIIGLSYFEDYTISSLNGLKYQYSFSGIIYTGATLFRIFTLDGWHDLLEDVLIIKDPVLACTYFILWIIIGAFIFRNLYIGIMVNNFQSIRTELQKEMEEVEKNRKAELRKESFNIELMKQDLTDELNPEFKDNLDNKKGISENTVIEATSKPLDGLDQTNELHKVSSNAAVSKTLQEGKKWDGYVRKNLDVLSRVPQKTVWPKDTLFVYFQLMEALMENLEEKKDILEFIG
ncbi:unnamed protein product [Gordionus sp. m RMFG-2023]